MNDENPTARVGETPFVVGIGASAGGLIALERLFSSLPSDSGLVYVVVQHLSPKHESMMDELLARYTQMSIVTPEDGTDIRPNTVYLIPVGKNIEMRGGRLRVVEPASEGHLNKPIDVFFESLAEDVADRSIGIVLSGTGSDGSIGINSIREADGLVLAHDPDSAEFDGMPRAAIDTGVVDVVAPPEAMAEWLTRYVLNPENFPRGETAKAEGNESIVISQDPFTATIFRLFRQRYGIDFSYYRAATISRRLKRRVAITGCENMEQYLALLQESDSEVDALYRDLLVEVTSFFRDEEAFIRIQKTVFEIVQNTQKQSEIRIWVPGCATGEEAYSLAMVFDDCLMELGRECRVKVFATDVHPTSLETASSGVYSRESFAKIPEKFRENYFQRVGDLFHVTRRLRQTVVFAPHDITRDPPFTRLDLISCRNVLIYFEPVVQRRVLSLFHFGLKVGGTLFLGPSETVGKLDSEFESVDVHWRIFQKLRDVRLTQSTDLSLKSPIAKTFAHRPSYVSTATRGDRSWTIPEAHELLLQRYVPASVLVNKYHEVEHTFGDARHFLIQPAGKTTLDITKLVSRGLAAAIIAGLHKAKSSKQPLIFRNIESESTEGPIRIDVTVEEFKKSRDEMYLITFEECTTAIEQPEIVKEEATLDSDALSVERITILERELAYTKETLQATVEELETSNEELQSTNEELVASNEELQSTNEELQSVNEELHTVNSEHQQKIGELTNLTTEINNLLQCSRVGTIFLDRDLTVKKFTPAAQEVFHLIEQDIGRPLEHIASQLDDVDVIELVKQSLEGNKSIEVQVAHVDGGAYLLNCFPHSEDAPVPGVVVQTVSLTTVVR